MIKKGYLQALKLIGVILFVFILSRIDREQVRQTLQNADQALLLASFTMLFVVYMIKTMRWHLLAKKAGAKTTLYESWKVYQIGIFFASFTPAKIGEFGRAIYLKKQGLQNIPAFGTAIFDRLADAVVIGILTIPSLWILFGKVSAFVLALSILVIVLLVFAFLQRTSIGKKILMVVPLLRLFLMTETAFLIFGFTMISWCAYYAWVLLLAQALHIQVDPLIMIATCTIAGIIALLPIAPSGLGTRDAAFIYFLAPFGILSEQAVSLAFVMFASILLSAVPGSIYWLKGLR